MSTFLMSFLISINFATDFYFVSGLPPCVSDFKLKKILKSPAKIFCLVWMTNKFFSNFKVLLNLCFPSFNISSITFFLRYTVLHLSWHQELKFFHLHLFIIHHGPQIFFQNKQLDSPRYHRLVLLKSLIYVFFILNTGTCSWEKKTPLIVLIVSATKSRKDIKIPFVPKNLVISEIFKVR